jgi:hypothetical protein
MSPTAVPVRDPPLAPPAVGREVNDEKAAAALQREAEKLRRLGLTKVAKQIAADAALYTAGEAKRREVKHRKLSTKDREADTLAKLAMFKTSALLANQPSSNRPAALVSEREGHTGVARFAAQGLYYAEADDEAAGCWRTHQFKPHPERPSGDAGDASGRKASDYEVVDPRAAGRRPQAASGAERRS